MMLNDDGELVVVVDNHDSNEEIMADDVKVRLIKGC